MSRKIVFFDIDGTLWDFHMTIPESTRAAIKKLRSAGNLAFINSGRTRSFINSEHLLSLGFDGIVSGCGTMIEWSPEGRDIEVDICPKDVLYYYRMPREMCLRTVETVRRHHFRPILEGRTNLYMVFSEFDREPYGDLVIKTMGDKLLPLMDHWGEWEISKLSCDTENVETAACFEELSDLYDFLIHDEKVVEFVPKGFDKAKGLLHVLELLNIDLSDSYAVGDSVNDLGMLRAAGTGIAMGDGTEAAKAAADYITTPLHEDGIYRAMEHFGLF
ncbi:MAG: HAD hydrolase family protein [bacterium]